MIDLDVRSRAEDDAVVTTIRRADSIDKVTYRSGDVPLAARPETAVAGLLLSGMASGDDIQLSAPLDSTFRDHLDTVQDIYTTWGRALSRIEVKENGRQEGEAAAQKGKGKTASFFTGGVDSFYTFLKRQQEVDALIFVHGFDVPLDDRALRSTVSHRLGRVAEAYDTKFIEVETTLRDVTDRERMTPEFHNWELSHGSALASVAHALSGEFDRIYIPATHTYSNIYPFGSHPLLDPLWSSASLDLVQDGCEAGRIEKCGLIAQHDRALRALRVCWKNPEGTYNCGRCEKCMRTMLILKSIGVLDRCRTFNEDLTPRDIAGIYVREKRRERYYEAVLKRLRQAGKNQKMRRAIKVALCYSRLKRGARGMLQWMLN